MIVTRRQLLVALMGTAGSLPFICLAKPPGRLVRVGILNSSSASGSHSTREALAAALSDLGYVDGTNLVIDARFADGKYERLDALAAELVALKPDVIVAVSSFSVEAARKVTSTTPIIMIGVGDPVERGFVKSLNHPGGNITGLSNVSVIVSSKYLEILHTAFPKISRVGVLINPAHPSHPTILQQIKATAAALMIQVAPVEARTAAQLPKALDTVLKERADALIVPIDPLFNSRAREIVDFVSANRVPTMFGYRVSINAGGLMSYDRSDAEEIQRAAAMVDKILNGAKPGEMPVELPSKFDLVVNMKTARTLGFTIPQEILLRADKVIE